MSLLEFKNISAGYGDLKVLFNVSMEVDSGEVVSLVGSNGAGKTTLLRIICGLSPVTSGSIIFDGIDLLAKKTHNLADLGIAHIPQGRGTLRRMTVKENLTMGAYCRSKRKNIPKNIEYAYQLMPKLKQRQNQIAGSLSGGEQQMLAIARAMMMEPRLIIMDEPSLGLAPIITEEVFDLISKVAEEKIGILLVEQNLSQALSIASRGYVLENGHIVLSGAAKELFDNPSVREAYLGI